MTVGRAVIVSLLLSFWMAPAARADYSQEHPEWFGITSPPDGELRLADTFSSVRGFIIHPRDFATHVSLVGLLAEEELVVLYGGQEDKAEIEAVLSKAGVPADGALLVDMEQLNTAYAGDYAPLMVMKDDAVVMIDPRYYPDRDYDDAAGSKLAKAMGTCSFRPPLLAMRGFIDTNGSGLCVVSTRLFAINPYLTEMEVRWMLKTYLGCQQVLSLQALQEDGEGRLDTFFRFPNPGKVFIGRYEVSQDSPNRLILENNKKKLEAELPDSILVQQIPMPSPIPQGTKKLRPSYLAYLVTTGAILVPVFENDTEHEEEALSLLQLASGGRDVVPLESTILVQSGTRLTGLVAAVPDAEWDIGCQPPKVLCDVQDPKECDLCFDECEAGAVFCISPKQAASCKVGSDGCTDVEVKSCMGEETCQEGVCVPPPTECDLLPWEGICEGDIAIKCEGQEKIVTDCSKQGMFCGLGDDGRVTCLFVCGNPCIPGESKCSDDGLAVIECLIGPHDCPYEHKVECPNGTVCTDGACTAPPIDQWIEPDVAAVGDDAGMRAGFRRKTGGCATGATHSPGAGVLLLLLIILTSLHITRSSVQHVACDFESGSGFPTGNHQSLTSMDDRQSTRSRVGGSDERSVPQAVALIEGRG